MNNNISSYKSLPCNKCGRIVENVGENATGVVCSYCTMMLVGMPEESKSDYKPTGRPPGWHFMNEFVDKDGNVFHKGKEQPKLKGTLPPTKVTPPKKKQTKRRTKDQILVAQYKEKQKIKREFKKQQDFINHNINKE